MSEVVYAGSDLAMPHDGSVPQDMPVLPSDFGGPCPCPVESYCDLTTQTCKSGCTTEDGCAKDRWCDIPARVCKPGCGKDAACPMGQVCDENHTCIAGCRGCGTGIGSAICEDNKVCATKTGIYAEDEFGCFDSQCEESIAICHGFYAPAYGYHYYAKNEDDIAEGCACSGNKLVVTLFSSSKSFTCPHGCFAWDTQFAGSTTDNHWGCW
jgi:hypothetical protein